MITYTYLPDRDKWRVELDGLVAIQHDLSEAIRRVIDQIGIITLQSVNEHPAMDSSAGSVTAITDTPQELA